MRLRLFFALVGAGLAAGLGRAGEPPVAVSPGEVSKVGVIEVRCPTFSWGGVEGAASYELVVYRVGEESQAQEPVLQRSFPGSVESWTPLLEDCPQRGARYAWSMRATVREEASDWSVPRLFEVAAGPSDAEIDEVFLAVRQLLLREPARDMKRHAEGSPAAGSSSPSGSAVGGASPGPASLPVTAGDSALQVNGSAVVTTATLGPGVGALLCRMIDYRYLDLGDGTVLDCATDLIWLKNANCFGLRTWYEAESDAASLAHGACGLTDGSVAGAWRQPDILEFCRAWSWYWILNLPRPCPATAAWNSLINLTYASPAVGNAAGDGQWTPEDAFAQVQSDLYWSAAWWDASAWSAWGVNLQNGDVNTFNVESLRYVWPVRPPP